MKQKKCCCCGNKKDLTEIKNAIIEPYDDCDVLVKEGYMCKSCLSRGKIKKWLKK